MADDRPPRGERFTHVYVPRGTPTADSVRIRRRAAAHLASYFDRQRDPSGLRWDLIKFINTELGLDVPQHDLTAFFRRIDLPDFLDSITIIWHFIFVRTQTGAEHWRSFIQRAMDEENVGYWIDEKGGVHYRPDEEFQRARMSTVAGLQMARYGAVRGAFEDALGHLDRQDGKGAIRSTFEAVETLAKLMAGDRKIARLSASEVDRVLKPLAQNLYGAGTPEGGAAKTMLGGLSDWINAAHVYRHGQRSVEPAPPPLELSVAMVSAGAGYLRWLVEIDQRTQKQPA